MNLLTKFERNWKNKTFTHGDQTVLLAVSGGLDSMVMCYLALQTGIKAAIAHCNFQLRGEESDADELFVKNFAAQVEVPFFSVRFDTANVAAERKTGIQETARWLRYNWLENIRQEHHFHVIATAHHANDNVETVLMNFFKGTGISGLHGIQEKNGKIIRPLLFVSRKEIVQYAEEKNISFREDSSNQSEKYLRNAVRLKVLPVIEQFFPEAVMQMQDSISRFAQTEILYQNEVRRTLRKLKEERGNDIYIPLLKLKKVTPLEILCYELFKIYGFTSAQIPHIINLLDAESGRYLTSQTHKVIKDRKFLIVTHLTSVTTGFIQIESLPSVVETTNGTFHFTASEKKDTFPKQPNIACIDAAKIHFPLILRRWRQGDYFYPLGMGMKKKKLSRFFIDQKLPLHEKENIWVLESDKRIVWVCGLRLDERFKISLSTHTVLQVEMWMQ